MPRCTLDLIDQLVYQLVGLVAWKLREYLNGLADCHTSNVLVGVDPGPYFWKAEAEMEAQLQRLCANGR